MLTFILSLAQLGQWIGFCVNSGTVHPDSVLLLLLPVWSCGELQGERLTKQRGVEQGRTRQALRGFRPLDTRLPILTEGGDVLQGWLTVRDKDHQVTVPCKAGQGAEGAGRWEGENSAFYSCLAMAAHQCLFISFLNMKCVFALRKVSNTKKDKRRLCVDILRVFLTLPSRFLGRVSGGWGAL